MEHLVTSLATEKEWSTIEPIREGWSWDKKYYVKARAGDEYVLRISPISKWEQKKTEFDTVTKVSTAHAFLSRPIELARLGEQGQWLYLLYTWIEGRGLEEQVTTLAVSQQYALGVSAGKCLLDIHKIPAPSDTPPWELRFAKKMNQKIRQYQACSLSYPFGEQMIEYLRENEFLLKDRSQVFHHGDYHTGNFLLTPSGKLGVIDWDRMDFGDPWEEFNRIVWSAKTSPAFASGLLDGYFSGKVPEEFFRLLLVYIISNQLSHLPWAFSFDEEEIHTAIALTTEIYHWYNAFESIVPSWYQSRWTQ